MLDPLVLLTSSVPAQMFVAPVEVSLLLVTCRRPGARRVQTTQAGELTGQGQGSAVGHVDGVGGTGVEDDAASREKGPNTFSLPDCLCFVTHSPPPTVMDYITDVTKGANHE